MWAAAELNGASTVLFSMIKEPVDRQVHIALITDCVDRLAGT